MEKAVDVLVVGAGLAGMTAALAARERGATVRIVAKGSECASDHVLGFNAPVGPGDSPALFYEDTLRVGGRRNRPELVRALTENACASLARFEAAGLAFDRREDGSYSCLQPLGCTVPRLVHIGNGTGRTIRRWVSGELARLGVTVETDASLESLVIRDGKAAGAVLLDRSTLSRVTVPARAVVIATGGVHMHTFSTYAATMTGDGVAATLRAGAAVTDMDCIQFEPCHCLYPKPIGISTTLLSAGGTLWNVDGERFVLRHYPTEGAAPKDALARIVAEEIRAGRGTPHGGVWLDLRSLPDEVVRVKHESYYKLFLAAGIDPFRDRIEVGPCAHSFMGGIAVDARCASAIPGLYAAGEAAGGLHGGSRMGGNAGTEIVVFGFIAGGSAADYAGKADTPAPGASAELLQDGEGEAAKLLEIRSEILAVMNEHMGVLRDAATAREALAKLADIRGRLEGFVPRTFREAEAYRDAENLLTVAAASARATEARK